MILAHCGIPWIDEAMFMLTKHPNFYADLSYHLATVSRPNLYRWLSSLEDYFVPLEKLFFGSDYPGFLYDPVALAKKLRTVNEDADGLLLATAKIDGLLGDNAAAVLMLN